MKSLTLFFPTLFILTLSAGAMAADTWSTVHPGVRLLRRTVSGPSNRIYMLEVDTCARGVSHRATKQSEKPKTPTQFRNLVGAQASINGDFFNYTGYVPLGLAVGDGSRWHNDAYHMAFLAAGVDQLKIFPAGFTLNTLEWWMRNAVGGFPNLVVNGVPQYGATDPPHCPNREPRSAVGISKDRQYLYLVVVDGRSSSSRGMTCNQMADLMLSLGAYNAFNLDGGGSSAISVQGIGTVNYPSGGSERSVANHWAIYATGSGAPGSCDLWMDELIVDSGVLNQGRSTDMNGDGLADFCARGANGFRCYISTGAGFQSTPWLITDLSDTNGYDQELRFSTIRTGDVNGDGMMDVCARGAQGIRCWPSTGSGFGPAFNGPGWADADGWAAFQHATTFRLADVTGDGMDDFCALAAVGWLCYPSTGSGIGTAIQGPQWTGPAGWHSPYHYGTIRTGDLNGDGLEDVCARAAVGMICAHSTGTGYTASFPGPAWSNTMGFTDVAYWSTIRMLDIDGDGLSDLCARRDTGVECYRSLGNGTFSTAIPGPPLTDTSGWRDMDNGTTLRFADIDGDGDLDICARADAGILCWKFNGTDYATQIVGPTWSDADGWEDFRFYTSINLGDVNSDGMADICARGAQGVTCYLSDGNGFPTSITGPALTDAVGWSAYRYFSTVRFGGRLTPPQCEPSGNNDATCDGVDDDCDGVVDEDAQSACDDGDPCNGVEVCSEGQCFPGTPQECGGRGCLAGSGCCAVGTHLEEGSCRPDPCDVQNDTCSDGDLCNGLEYCSETTGECVSDSPPVCGNRGCLPDSGCCPVGTKLNGTTCEPIQCALDPNVCDDGDLCNGVEICDTEAGICAAGTPPDCGERGCLYHSGCCPEGTRLEGEQCVYHPDSGDVSGGGCSCRVTSTPPPRGVGLSLLMGIVLLLLGRSRHRFGRAREESVHER